MQFSIISVIACAAIALAAPTVEVAVQKRNLPTTSQQSSFQQACQVAGGNFSCCSRQTTNNIASTPANGGLLTGLLGPLTLSDLVTADCSAIPIVNLVPLTLPCDLNNNAAACCNNAQHPTATTQQQGLVNANVPISALNGCNFIGL